LYSAKEDTWKIADFGLTVQGSATMARTTIDARGTASYRAPELVSAHLSYTNKVDIWALGCILYELIEGKTAFNSDCEALGYSEKDGKEILSSHYSDEFVTQATVLLWKLLRQDYRERPDISQVTSELALYLETPTKDEQQTYEDLYDVNGTDPEEIMLQSRLSEAYTVTKDENMAVSGWYALWKRHPMNMNLLRNLCEACNRKYRSSQDLPDLTLPYIAWVGLFAMLSDWLLKWEIDEVDWWPFVSEDELMVLRPYMVKFHSRCVSPTTDRVLRLLSIRILLEFAVTNGSTRPPLHKLRHQGTRETSAQDVQIAQRKWCVRRRNLRTTRQLISRISTFRQEKSQ
jgi:serine/threonine protein kinase